MKASELRIGNLIEFHRKIELIKGIEDDWVGLSKSYRVPLNALGLNPIELTEEWLIKMGFGDTGNKKWIHGKFGFSLIKGFKFYKSGVLPEVKYVHQLQNLYFALTGEELTIKN